MSKRILIVKVGSQMFTIIQKGEQGNLFYTIQANGQDVEHFTSLESACHAIEDLKSYVKEREGHKMVRWIPLEEE